MSPAQRGALPCLAPWWQQGSLARAWPVWSGVLATLALFGLLLAFHQVVSGAVQQGELRRTANAMQAQATWRCNALADMRLRENCLVRLH